MKVKLTFVGQEPPMQSRVVDMPAAPREGDAVHLGPDEDLFVVRTVAWYPDADDFDVYVVLR